MTSLRTTPTADGVVVEMEVLFTVDGADRMWCDAHILHTEAAPPPSM